MALSLVWGIVSIIIFYAAILAVGVWASRKVKSSTGDAGNEEEVMLAGRNIGPLVGICTMTATWVGGGYINGTAEYVAKNGLVDCQAPFGYALSLVFGGLLFAKKMRDAGYVTMLDPFSQKFGERMGGLLFIPALLGEVFWSAAILSALGATLEVVIGLSPTAAVIVSAVIAVGYTLIGGLYSVAYTDVVQMGCILFGLVLVIPFAANNEHVGPMFEDHQEWLGEMSPYPYIWKYIDLYLLLIFGGIPWQVYFQRVLSSRSSYYAQMLSFCAAAGCFVLAIPPIFIGIIAKNTNWANTTFGANMTDGDYRMTLPLVIQHLTPGIVPFIGLGAVSAAVMSSADSSVLSASSMFARNVYKLVLRPKASEKEVIWVMRISILGVGALATYFALTIKSIYGLWILCADLVYVVLFPQLLSVVYLPYNNTYGSLAGYLLGFFFRLAGGEDELNLPPLIIFPMYQDGVQHFPFRTFSMLINFFAMQSVSALANLVFLRGYLPVKADVFRCVVNFDVSETMPLQGSTTMDIASKLDNGVAKPGILTPTQAANEKEKEVNAGLTFSPSDIVGLADIQENSNQLNAFATDSKGFLMAGNPQPPSYSSIGTTEIRAPTAEDETAP